MAHSSQPGALERLIVLTAASRKPPGPAADSEAARIRPRLLGPSERVLCDLRQALNGGWPQGRLRTTRETSPPSCPPRSEGSAKGGAASTAGTRPPTPTQRASRAPGLSRPPRSAVTSALRPPAPRAPRRGRALLPSRARPARRRPRARARARARAGREGRAGPFRAAAPVTRPARPRGGEGDPAGGVRRGGPRDPGPAEPGGRFKVRPPPEPRRRREGIARLPPGRE